MSVSVTNNTVFAKLVLATEAGEVLTGGYKEVWETLETGADWCHFRGVQIGAAGRKWEDFYNIKFSTLCPDLEAHASSWTGLS